MAAEQFHDMMQDDIGSDYTSSLDDRKSAPTAVSSSDDNNTSGGFECNICLDSVQDPVVTFCGHLFCWPCIYKWLHQSTATDNQDQLEQQCPVCKAEISQSTLIPLYGRDQGSKPAKAKASDLNLVIPRRPAGPAYDIDPSRLRTTIFSPHSTQHFHYRTYPYQPELYHGQLGTYAGSSIFNPVASQTITSNTFSHLISMFGDVVYARMFGVCTYANSYNLEHRTSPRMRRRMMQADKSLNRICFFLFCCVILCLFSF